MKRLRFSLLSVLVLFTSACMTAPRLGFPVKSLDSPVPVTLFTAISPKGLLVKKMDLFGRETWRLLYDQRYLTILSQINLGGRFNKNMDDLFIKKTLETRDLFKLEKKEVFNGGLEYSKTPDDPVNYSGFDFSRYVNDIPTKYILALSIDEWGYIATQDKTTTGPYIILTIQLIDKDTSMSLWRYSNQYQKPVEDPLGATEPGDITQAQIEDVLQKLVPKAMDDYFNWLKK
jgi:hypothetical protein